MDFVVVGAGAIGGVAGALLQLAGHEVEFVARGDHLTALRSSGLVLERPGETATLRVEARARVADVGWARPRVVLLAVKSQDTEAVLTELEAVAPARTPVFCMQNGVENERCVLRRFPNAYGVCVMCPATHLRPGVVQAHSSPVSGLFDLGRYPHGTDETADRVAAALCGSGLESIARSDIMRWKHAKLLANLANAVEALCGPGAVGSELARCARAEGRRVLAHCGIEFVDGAEYRARRGDTISLAATASGAWAGGSSWQSAVRGAGSIEADYLNGEIVLLGRSAGVGTPVNALLQRRANELAAGRAAAATADPDELLEAARTGTV